MAQNYDSLAYFLAFHRLWSSVPEVRADISRCSHHKHVIVAERETLELIRSETRFSGPIHVLTISEGAQSPADTHMLHATETRPTPLKAKLSQKTPSKMLNICRRSL